MVAAEAPVAVLPLAELAAVVSLPVAYLLTALLLADPPSGTDSLGLVFLDLAV